MKFLCLACNEPMKLEDVSSSDEKGAPTSVSITFSCEKCHNKIAMLTNPMESQLVKGLGVHVGGRNTPYEPMEVIKDNLLMKNKTEEVYSSIDWDKEAEERFLNIPPFVRPMARAGIERYASEKGYSKITLEVMAEARQMYGM